MDDCYKRIAKGSRGYQCGCKWEFRKDKFGCGDVLVECMLHQQATLASVRKFERERAAKA